MVTSVNNISTPNISGAPASTPKPKTPAQWGMHYLGGQSTTATVCADLEKMLRFSWKQKNGLSSDQLERWNSGLDRYKAVNDEFQFRMATQIDSAEEKFAQDSKQSSGPLLSANSATKYTKMCANMSNVQLSAELERLSTSSKSGASAQGKIASDILKQRCKAIAVEANRVLLPTGRPPARAWLLENSNTRHSVSKSFDNIPPAEFKPIVVKDKQPVAQSENTTAMVAKGRGMTTKVRNLFAKCKLLDKKHKKETLVTEAKKQRQTAVNQDIKYMEYLAQSDKLPTLKQYASGSVAT